MWPLDTQPEDPHKLGSSRHTGQLRLQRGEVHIMSLLPLRVSQSMSDMDRIYTLLKHMLEVEEGSTEKLGGGTLGTAVPLPTHISTT